jgi:catechol 2,3-dioxygenase-like lactoylglutathione lyase family enzyme
VDFFGDVLGWRRIARPGNIGVAAAWLEIVPGCELHLVEDPEFEPSRFEREFGRHIAVTFPRAGFPGLKERLGARGAALIEPLRETPFARFFFRDPNGYVFEVVEDEHDEPRPIA